MGKSPVWLLSFCLCFALLSLGCFDSPGDSPGEEEDDGNSACLQDTETNASAKVHGGKIEMHATSNMVQATCTTPTGIIWCDQLTLVFYSGKLGCHHKLTFWIRNPTPGAAKMGLNFIEGASSYTGLCAGDEGPNSLTSESALTVKSIDSKVSGTFTAVLENGTIFSSGKFTDVPVN
jgi:hypothetical protein